MLMVKNPADKINRLKNINNRTQISIIIDDLCCVTATALQHNSYTVNDVGGAYSVKQPALNITVKLIYR